MSEPEIDALLQHSRWARALAESLARDPGLAEDIVQETWLSALRRGPRDDRSLRGWLATLLRRHARQARRGAERRSAREEDHARELAQPSTADLVLRAESQRDMAQAVLDLREPFRSTVLQRYFEELSPDEIAARMGVPLPTVHSRLARGLAMLRERLERERPSRSTWAGWLGGLRGVTPGVAVAAGIVALLLGTWIVASSAGERRPRASALDQQAARAPLDDVRTTATELGTTREALSGEPAPGAQEGGAARPMRTGRVLDRNGMAVPEVEIVVTAAGAEGAAAEQRSTSALDGTFRFLAPSAAAQLRASDPRYETVLLCLVDPEREADFAVVVAPKVALAGRVLTAQGEPVAGATLDLRIDPRMAVSYERELDFNRPGSWCARSGVDGAFRFESLPSLPEARIFVSHPGLLGQVVPVPEQNVDELAIVLEPPPAEVPRVRGRVLDADGRPVAGALVSALPAATSTDGAGRFELVLWPAPLHPRLVAVQPGVGAAVLDVAVLDVAADERTEPVWPESITLQLVPPGGQVSGRVLDERGRPVAGARVWLADATPACSSARGPLFAEALSCDPDTRPWCFAESDATGTFRVAGMFERAYRLCALDPSTLVQSEHTVRPGEHVELPLPDAQVERIAGRVVDSRGRPLSGVAVCVTRTVLDAQHEGESSFTASLSLPRVLTDANGRFEFARCSAAGTGLSLESDEILPATFALAELEEREDLRLVASRRTHLRVELGEPVGRADAFEALDGKGQRLLLTQLRQGCSHPHLRAPLVAGRSLVLAISDEVRELVLFRGAEEVWRTPIALEPGALNLFRW